MNDYKSIVSQISVQEYGAIRVKLAEVLEKKQMTRNHLATLLGVRFEIVDRYYKGEGITMADLNFLAKVCFVLGCEVTDLLEYQRPE